MQACSTEPDPDEVFTTLIGGSKNDWAFSVEQTFDGGYIIGGTTFSSGAGWADYYLIKTNSSGNVEWQRTYGGNDYDRGRIGRQLDDGGYILIGYRWNTGENRTYIYLLNTSVNGYRNWSADFGDAGNSEGNDVIPTFDGGYAIAGKTDSKGSGGYDAWMIKTGSQGVVEWEQTFGGTGDDEALAIIQTADSNFALTGYRSSGASTDLFLIKIDTSGTVLWEKTFGGAAGDTGFAVQQDTAGNFFLAGVTGSSGAGGSDGWLIKTNEKGVSVWQQTYGGTGDDRFADLVLSSDDVPVAVGAMAAADGDIWLLKANASGAQVWSHEYDLDGTDHGFGIAATADGGFIITGTTQHTDSTNSDIVLIKTDSKGNY